METYNPGFKMASSEEGEEKTLNKNGNNINETDENAANSMYG